MAIANKNILLFVFPTAEFQARRVKELEEEYQKELETLRKEFDTERYYLLCQGLL